MSARTPFLLGHQSLMTSTSSLNQASVSIENSKSAELKPKRCHLLRVPELGRAETAVRRIEASVRTAVPHVERVLLHIEASTWPHVRYAVPLADPAGAISSTASARSRPEASMSKAPQKRPCEWCS